MEKIILVPETTTVTPAVELSLIATHQYHTSETAEAVLNDGRVFPYTYSLGVNKDLILAEIATLIDKNATVETKSEPELTIETPTLEIL